MILVHIEERHLEMLYLLAKNMAEAFPATAVDLCGTQTDLNEVMCAAAEALGYAQEEPNETA